MFTKLCLYSVWGLPLVKGEVLTISRPPITCLVFAKEKIITVSHPTPPSPILHDALSPLYNCLCIALPLDWHHPNYPRPRHGLWFSGNAIQFHGACVNLAHAERDLAEGWRLLSDLRTCKGQNSVRTRV